MESLEAKDRVIEEHTPKIEVWKSLEVEDQVIEGHTLKIEASVL